MIAETKDEMRDKILDAALKRFSNYTASKTTMNEIADDLHCSKASLYYYFSDKKSLHFAVLEKIGEHFISEQEMEAEKDLPAASILMNLLEIKRQFVLRYCRLEMFKILNDNSAETLRVMAIMKEREQKMMTRIMEKGVAAGDFKIRNISELASLYSQAIEGLRFSVLDCINPKFELEPDEIEKIIDKQRLLTEIFVKGIKQ
ncbi:TetR/AcrR family transcriptional regulator [Chitinophaga silvisoli]|uniref:TetR/AcrR family transcriptional regulator n=1 Tax=Chitinophaga silvisoli TaxID=2291814 RepID=A0A3E1P5S0_9BACT|nr:TetR/AcrR family transcriptional regulator [Chitinophaga silvisoli]RFM35454.1 TetR/AcrR family transcriptional regulator [Chitinophaga silvisoli]